MDPAVFPPTVDDLTGCVLKIGQYPFAYGGNSEIWKGQCKCDSRILEVAVKVMKGTQDAITCKRLIREIRVLAVVNHPNISPLYGVSFDFDRPDMPCLVFPYHHYGEISRYIKEHAGVNILPLIAQIADALSHMHSLSIIHGDIKGPNIVINDNRQASVIDFGLARILRTSGFTTATSKGTWRYWAPERLHDVEGIQQITTATDVYAFSMAVVEIFTGHIPFPHIKNDAAVVITVIQGGRPQRDRCLQVTDDIWQMLERCWDADPERRPSMANIAHFFSSKSISSGRHLARY